MENKNQQINKWQKLAKRLSLLWLLSIVAFIVVSVVASQQSDANHAAPSWVNNTLIGLFLVNAALMLGYLFSKIASFVAKRRAPKEDSENVVKSEKAQPVGWRAHKKLIFAGGAALILFILFLFGSQPETCKDTECFVAAANNGKAATLQSTDKAGIQWSYQIKGALGSGQTFTKTLLRLDDKEPQLLKDLLQGKSLTCQLHGVFDERLVTSLFYGIGNNCSGELKEKLGQLLFLL